MNKIEENISEIGKSFIRMYDLSRTKEHKEHNLFLMELIDSQIENEQIKHSFKLFVKNPLKNKYKEEYGVDFLIAI